MSRTRKSMKPMPVCRHKPMAHSILASGHDPECLICKHQWSSGAETATLCAANARLIDVIRCAIVDLSDAAAMYGGSDGRPDMLKKVMLDNVTALKKALDWPMEAKA